MPLTPGQIRDFRLIIDYAMPRITIQDWCEAVGIISYNSFIQALNGHRAFSKEQEKAVLETLACMEGEVPGGKKYQIVVVQQSRGKKKK